MGTWETEIFRNDVSESVMTDYKNKLKIGKTDDDALKKILDENEEYMSDDEDKFDFWFGLALAMSDLGRLTDEVKNTAVKLIDCGGDLFRFEDNKSVLKNAKQHLKNCVKSLSESSRSARKSL